MIQGSKETAWSSAGFVDFHVAVILKAKALLAGLGLTKSPSAWPVSAKNTHGTETFATVSSGRAPRECTRAPE
jgi:hypothetical protein